MSGDFPLIMPPAGPIATWNGPSGVPRAVPGASNESVIPPEVRARLQPETRKLLGLERSLPDYSSVRKLSREQIDQLSPLEKEVIGIGIY